LSSQMPAGSGAGGETLTDALASGGVGRHAPATTATASMTTAAVRDLKRSDATVVRLKIR